MSLARTTRLYYDDPYLLEFDATVVAAQGNRVTLDRTAFYPTSGGQPFDTGTIDGVAVLDVIDEGDQVVHIVSVPPSSSVVHCRVDEDRRYDHMQQHTGQHLLSAVFADQFRFDTLSFHLGPQVSTIELNTASLTDEQVQQAAHRTNAIIRESRPVTIFYLDSNEADGLRRASERSGALRIIAIEGCDRTACGGTHVRNTAEIGPLQIRRQEKIRGHVRLEFVCGDRALRRAATDFRLLAESARTIGVPIDEVLKHVATLVDRVAQAEKDAARLRTEAARAKGAELHRATNPDSGGIRRLLLEAHSIDDMLREKLKAFIEEGRAIALATATESASVLVACSTDSGVHAGSVLKDVLSRGGGSATMAQGNLPASEALPRLLARLGWPTEVTSGTHAVDPR